MNLFNICAIHRGENPHLLEWCCHHLLLGADHIVLYDDNREDEEKADGVLAPLVRMGRVTNIPCSIIHHPSPYRQMGAYTHYLGSFKAQWTAFIDLDEFIVETRDMRLTRFLANFRNTEIGGIGLSWCVFGSSGAVTRPQFVMKENLHRSPESMPENRHIKTIVHHGYALEFDNPHYPLYRRDRRAVTPSGGPVKLHAADVDWRLFRVNHYMFRSQENMAQRISRGRVDAPAGYDMNYMSGIEAQCIIPDQSAADRYLNDVEVMVRDLTRLSGSPSPDTPAA